MNILVVDDEDMIREGVAAFLREEGYHVILAKDGQEALEKFHEFPIHLMVLDLMLPKRSGFEVLKEINGNHDIPVIVLSALGDEETQMQVFDLYADDHVTKPFSLVLLVKRIQALLRRYYVVEWRIFGIIKMWQWISHPTKLESRTRRLQLSRKNCWF